MPDEYRPSDDDLNQLNEVVLRVGRAFSTKRGQCPTGGHAHVSEAQLMMMRRLAESGGMRQTEIAQLLNIGAPAVSGLVDHFVALGIGERKADPNDRRATVVGLTNKGILLLEQYEADRHKLMRQYTADFTKAEMDSLISACNKLLANVEREEK